jgi:hypothetical protein
MCNYIFLIYDERLSTFECQQLSDLLYGAKVELLPEEEAHPITCAHFHLYDYSSLGSCYRIFCSEYIGLFGLIGKTPSYAGILNQEVESRLLNVAKFCLLMANEILTIDGLWSQARSIDYQYKSIFDNDKKLDWQQLKQLEQQYREMLMDAEWELTDIFEDNSFNKILSEREIKTGFKL